MTPEQFRNLLQPVTDHLAGRPLDAALVFYLLPQGAIEFTKN